MIGFSILLRRKLFAMNLSNHKNRETPGNFTLLIRDVRTNTNDRVMDINEI
jgi:hypothetical protein